MSYKNPGDLAKFLSEQSREICADNGCSDDSHNCESYAYLSIKYSPDSDTYYIGGVIDICSSDYFQGFNGEHIALPLPFEGNGDDLLDAFRRYDDNYRERKI